ncbi:WhiB family transcriptional regulator [Streptomyces sp. RFCAC02]|uniref:WhiB family transcriptional regulator n=1 Tax=Streptomyces sp. RFCAC02 TaxID=2499143 RepID=UPI001022A00A|nr:WhiB family transcriptional regulator [Streptomyces sp. RFCAC02]
MRYLTTNAAPPTTLRGIADHSWQPRGLCHGMDPADADELFFPTPRAHAQITEAKATCGRCPVRQACLDYALDNDLRHGIWGGLTETERRPWHNGVAQRMDYRRIRATFMGRDVHLSQAERETVVLHAYVRGWSAERLAYTLRLDLDWAKDLMRNAAHTVDDRDRYWGLFDTNEDGQVRSETAPATAGVFGRAA